jgi:hypothetical protein
LALCANTVCHVWLCIPKIMTVEMTITTIIAAEYVVEEFKFLLYL